MATIALTQILVPTDFSETSAQALRYAKALADQFAARLHVLHVVEHPIEQHWAAEMALVASLDILTEARQRSNEALAQVLTDAERQKYSAALVTEAGAPFKNIVEYAAREHIDLIVMGTHGRGPLAHLLIGSVAENVVRRAPCPVLTVPLPGREFTKP